MPGHREQISATLAKLGDILGDALIAVHLHGSAASGRLAPQSYIDLLVVVEGALTQNRRDALLAALLRFSARHPATPAGPRCLEVMVFSRSALAGRRFPPRAEFVYGEWLRDRFEAGERPAPTRDPKYTLVLAEARREATTLRGPDPALLLPEPSASAVRQAMRDLLPGLTGGFEGDERNVLLTLARMWHTAETGRFLSKDEAAAWAISRLGEAHAAVLEHARRAHLGDVAEDWNAWHGAARHLADHLRERVAGALDA